MTAVFALAVGIVVAFGASAAQPQPRAHVYLLRGLLNIFSLGMDSLAEELKRRDVDATVHSYGEWQTLADQAAADYKARKEASIILAIAAIYPACVNFVFLQCGVVGYRLAAWAEVARDYRRFLVSHPAAQES